jgi:predicted transcriptional regulator
VTARRTTSVRYPDEILARSERLAEVYRSNRPPCLPPSSRVTRSDVILLAIERGLEVLESQVSQAATGDQEAKAS